MNMTSPQIATESGLSPELQAAYLQLIEQRLGIRLSAQQITLLPEVIALHLSEHGNPTARSLYAKLDSNLGDARDVLHKFAADLTIGETHFFRVAPQIEALRSTVLPELLHAKADLRRLRMWSAGCSTGEEPFTLAILLRELMTQQEEWDIQLLATDLSHRALASAREGLYAEWSFRETPDWVRPQSFSPEGKRWRLNDKVRRMVRFEHLNLMSDTFPSPGPNGPDLDLILCRNVTIYFGPETTQRLYRRFAEALVPGGWLVLGPSDPTPEQPSELHPVALPSAILWRRSITAKDAEPVMTLTSRDKVTRLVTAPDRLPSRNMHRPVTPRPVAVSKRQRPTLAPAPAPGRKSDEMSRRAQAEQLVSTQPSDVDGHLLLGLIHLDEGANGPAIESLRRAAFLDSGHSFAHFSLASAYLQGGDATRALAAFSHVRRLLAAVPSDEVVPGGGMPAEELRYAVEIHLAALTKPGGS